MTNERVPNFRSEAYPCERSRVRRRTVVVILGTALLARLFATWVFIANHPKNWLFSHPYEMGFVANSLIHGLGYSSPFGGSTGPTAIVAPGYPTLIAGIFLVFGSYTLASAIAIMAMQILFSLLTIWLMIHIADEMLDSRSAIVAGAFWAVSLPLLWIPNIFWETSISACSVVGMIALALRCRRAPSRAAWILLGSCCSLVALVNPALLPSLVAIMGWVAYQMRRAGRTGPVLGLLALALVFAPWPIRNAYDFHAFIPLRSTVGLEMYMGNRPGATGRLDESLFPMINRAEFAGYVSKGEVAYTNGQSVEAWKYIRANPGVFVKLSLRRMYRFWAGTGNVDAPAIYEVHALLTTILGGVGLVLLWRSRMRGFAALMALPLLLFPFPYYITHAEFRYRLNIDPVLTILAAFAATQIVTAWSHRHSTAPIPQEAALSRS
jgi:hypothetical protein